MEDCIFCKIVNGDVLSSKIYEDDAFLAFLDIAPVHPGHILVIPKEHYPLLTNVPEEILQKYLIVVQKVSRALVDGLELNGFNLGMNNGSVAGQIVPHVHFHVMPRTEGDGLKLWSQRSYAEGEADEVAGKIKDAL
ncbi:HIT family protein [Patescibacteria group bacterium]|nr:HIT family protein [Patescibacteria group bacterium]